MSDKSSASPDEISTRWPELGVAILLQLIAMLVIADSLRVGIGWADDGPRSGYFPFYVGLALQAASGYIFLTTLLQWRKAHKPFAEKRQLRDVAAVFVPMVVYVALIAWLGIYVPSALLIGYFMRRHGKYGVPFTLAVSIGVPVAFFLVFERWFLVPLPKGPLEAMLGF